MNVRSLRVRIGLEASQPCHVARNQGDETVADPSATGTGETQIFLVNGLTRASCEVAASVSASAVRN